MLGQSLVESQAEHDRVREGIGNLVGVQKTGNLSFPAQPVEPLGDVEYEIPSLVRQKASSQFIKIADVYSLMPQLSQCAGNRVDGFLAVELGRLFFSVPPAQVVIPEVVGYSDSHVSSRLGLLNREARNLAVSTPSGCRSNARSDQNGELALPIC